MVGTNVRFFLQQPKWVTHFVRSINRAWLDHRWAASAGRKRAPLFMASLEYTGASIKHVDSGLAGYLQTSAEYHFFQLGLAAYTFNGHIKSLEWWNRFKGGCSIVWKIAGEIWIDNNGARTKNEDIHITYPRVLQRFKIGPSVYVKKTVQLDEKNAIKPFLYSTLYLSDEVKFSHSKALVMGFG